MEKFKRYLVTTALPYANGPIHIGHLAGVYVPADIYVRYLRLKGIDIKFICGSDEHGVPITLQAKKKGVHPQEIVDKYHKLNKESFAKFGITFDIYSRTSNKVHHKTASEFFKTMYDKGEFIEKTTEQYYDEDEQQFLADRYIKGTCPHCKYEDAYGDQCEQCGTSLNPMDLIHPKSTISGGKLVKKQTKHWYLPLDRYQEEFLEEWLNSKEGKWKPNVFGACKSWLNQGLQPRAVSRDLDWGVPLPIENTDGKVLYVWFDAPIGYISATKELTSDWEKYWKSPDSRLIHFIGKDNIVFHCIIFPAMLKKEGTYILPDNVPANEFLNLESNKISTSKNWAVWLHEYLEDFQGKEDVLRYALTVNMPETKDNDFTWKDFQARNNNELVAILGNFVNRTLVLINKYYDGKIPEPAELSDYDKETLQSIPEIRKDVESNLENFKFREAVKAAMNLARLGNKYLADTEPWAAIKTDEERTKTILYVSAQITANLSLLIEPFLPFSAEKLRGFLNFAQLDWNKIGENDLLAVGHTIRKPKYLFTKIEDKVIEQQVNKLIEAKKQNEADEKAGKANISPQKPDITFDDFLRMDVRIGTIKEAEKVPKTKKLLKITIDTGLDERTVVSGIAEQYKPEDIIGTQVCILVNLEPKKIRGIQSQGMILMAENEDGELAFIRPEKSISNGTGIR